MLVAKRASGTFRHDKPPCRSGPRRTPGRRPSGSVSAERRLGRSEATGIGSCREVMSVDAPPLSASAPDRLTGTVCLGPRRDQSAVRGVCAHSPRDRIPGTPVAFPMGLVGAHAAVWATRG